MAYIVVTYIVIASTVVAYIVMAVANVTNREHVNGILVMAY